jgi:hypothetical protein
MATSKRYARFQVEKGSGIKISVPKGLNEIEFSSILKKIRDFTGCAGCAASGNQPIIFDQRYAEILELDLSRKVGK